MYSFFEISEMGITIFDEKPNEEWNPTWFIENNYTCTIKEIDNALSCFETYFERGRRTCNQSFFIKFNNKEEFVRTLYYIDYTDILSNENYYITTYEYILFFSVSLSFNFPCNLTKYRLRDFDMISITYLYITSAPPLQKQNSACANVVCCNEHLQYGVLTVVLIKIRLEPYGMLRRVDWYITTKVSEGLCILRHRGSQRLESEVSV